MKNQNGVTLLLLVATVLIMIIILGTITYTSIDSFKMDQYYKMCADIELLDGKISLYYLNHKDDTNGGLPVDKSQEVSDEIKTVATTEGNVNYNPNNNENFYKIDLVKLDNLTLNHNGNFYINEKSHTVYYSTGYELDGETYYTIPKKYKKSDADDIKKSLYCTVDFNYNNGEETTSQTIRSGTKLARPNNPTKTDYEFAGWYYAPDGDTETEFDFDSEITQDYELHAKWVGLAVMMARSNIAFWKEDIKTNITSIELKKRNNKCSRNSNRTLECKGK